MNSIIALVLMLVTSTSLQAGIRVDLESRGSGVGTDNGRFQGTVLVDNNRLHMDLGRGKSLVFLGAGPSLLLIDHTERWYTELDKATADSIASDLAPLVNQLREQLAVLPKEQRDWVVNLLGGTLKMDEPLYEKTLRVLDTGQKGTAPNGQECRWLQIYNLDELAQENCIGPSSGLPGGENLEAVLRTAGDFYQDVVLSINRSGALPIPDGLVPQMVPVGGLPLISRRYKDGKIVTDTRIMGSQKQDVSDEVFAAPTGYTRREPGLGMALPK